MPDPNNPNDNQNQNPVQDIPAVPPTPPTDTPTPQVFPEDTSIPPIPFGLTQTISDAPPQEEGTPPNLLPIISSGKPKKKFGGKMIATILGLLVLVGSLGAGIVLVKQQQDIREKAAYPYYCSLTGNRICVGNDVTGPCYQGGQGGQYACYKLTGNYGKEISGTTNCTCPSPYTWGPRNEMNKNWCFDTAAGQCDGQYPYAERCSLQPQQCTVATSTPTPPTAPPGQTPQCLNIKAYDTNWNQLTAAQLSSLKAGDRVRFTVSGTPANKIDKAKFKINGNQKPEVTQKKPGTDEYYDEYTIPAGVTSFTVNAKLHHVTLGWF